MITALLTSSWILASPFSSPLELKYDVKVEAHVGGETHNAELVYTVKSLKSSEAKPQPFEFSWLDINVDGQVVSDGVTVRGDVGPSGWIEKMLGPSDTEDDDFRRMILPFHFVYPNAEVAPEKPWNGKWTSASKLETTFEIIAAEGVESDTSKFTTKLREAGPDGMKSDGTWWIRKDGKVAKFELKVTNWIVPMAGPEPVEATIQGSLRG